MFSTKSALRFSAVVDKLDLQIDNPNASPEDVGKDLILQIIRKAHKAEPEIIDFIMTLKKCTKEEAEESDFIQLLKDYGKDILPFFKDAVKSKTQG